jgi:hypothetical protein
MKVLRQDNLSILAQIGVPENCDLITITTKDQLTYIRILYNDNDQTIVLNNFDLFQFSDELNYHTKVEKIMNNQPPSKYAGDDEPQF